MGIGHEVRSDGNLFLSFTTIVTYLVHHSYIAELMIAVMIDYRSLNYCRSAITCIKKYQTKIIIIIHLICSKRF